MNAIPETGGGDALVAEAYPRRLAARIRGGEGAACTLGRRGANPTRLRLEDRFCAARWVALMVALSVALGSARAQEALPPSPVKHVTDNARVLRPATVSELNQRLEQFERDTSSQVVVSLYPKLPANAALDDYANRLFKAWKIGQHGKDNGVLLLIFTADRRMRIEVGYGLEGSLPDATAKRIIEDEIAPRFRNADPDGGVTAGVNAIMAATKGEYRGSGRSKAAAGTAALKRPAMLFGVLGLVLGPLIRVFTTRGIQPGARLLLVASGVPVGALGFALVSDFFFRGIVSTAVILLMVTLLLLGVGRRSNVQYDRAGRRRISPSPGWTGWIGSGGFGGGGGGFGGGGFSGGGGRSGGGGASGGW